MFGCVVVSLVMSLFKEKVNFSLLVLFAFHIILMEHFKFTLSLWLELCQSTVGFLTIPWDSSVDFGFLIGLKSYGYPLTMIDSFKSFKIKIVTFVSPWIIVDHSKVGIEWIQHFLLWMTFLTHPPCQDREVGTWWPSNQDLLWGIQEYNH